MRYDPTRSLLMLLVLGISIDAQAQELSTLSAADVAHGERMSGDGKRRDGLVLHHSHVLP